MASFDFDAFGRGAQQTFAPAFQRSMEDLKGALKTRADRKEAETLFEEMDAKMAELDAPVTMAATEYRNLQKEARDNPGSVSREKLAYAAQDSIEARISMHEQKTGVLMESLQGAAGNPFALEPLKAQIQQNQGAEQQLQKQLSTLEMQMYESTERGKTREFKSGESEKTREFQASESALGREDAAGRQQAGFEHAEGMQASSQEFAQGQQSRGFDAARERQQAGFRASEEASVAAWERVQADPSKRLEDIMKITTYAKSLRDAGYDDEKIADNLGAVLPKNMSVDDLLDQATTQTKERQEKIRESKGFVADLEKQVQDGVPGAQKRLQRERSNLEYHQKIDGRLRDANLEEEQFARNSTPAEYAANRVVNLSNDIDKFVMGTALSVPEFLFGVIMEGPGPRTRNPEQEVGRETGGGGGY